MGKRKYVFNFKKWVAVFLAVALLMGMNGNRFVIEARADGETPTPQIKWHFDDRGNPDEDLVSVGVGEGDLVPVKNEDGTEYGYGSYRVRLSPPAGREESEPNIEIRIYEDNILKEIIANYDFYDEVNNVESGPNLYWANDSDFTFDFSSPNTWADVNIWWSEYDKACGWYDSETGDGDFCVEVCGEGGGEAYLDGMDCPVVWEYKGLDDENNPISWGGQKILVPAHSFDDENTVTIKFCSYEGYSFGRFEINGPEGSTEPIFVIDAAELQPEEEAKCQLSKDWFNESNRYYLNSNLTFDVETPQTPLFNINYDDHNGGKLKISGPRAQQGDPSYDNTEVSNGELTDFYFGAQYDFTLCPPSNRTEDCAPIVEVCVFKPEGDPEVFSTENDSLTVTDSRFTVQLPSEEDFRGVDINIWWSEFDKLAPNEDEYCLVVNNDGKGDAFFEDDYPNTFEYKEPSERGYGAQKFIIPKSEFVEGVGPVLNAHAYEEFYFDSIEVNGVDKEAPDGKYTLMSDDFSNGGFADANIRFSGGAERIVNYYAGENGTLSFTPSFEANKGNGDDEWYHGTTSEGELSVTITPDEGYKIDRLLINNGDETSNVVDGVYVWTLTDGDNNLEVSFKQGAASEAEKFANFITSQYYLYGDWNMDDNINEDDLRLGIAQQIYFPEFNNGNSEIKRAYPEIQSYNDLLSMITVGDANLAKNITATARDGSTYTVPAYNYSFTFNDPDNSDRNVNAEGVAWMFKFDDESQYATDTLNDVLMLTNDGTADTFYLRNNRTDAVDPVTGDPSGDGSLCAVGDYEVEFDSERNMYVREVAIIGNGSSLDNFLMTEDSETKMCTYQGRNEMFRNDVEAVDEKGRPVIFGKFSFYQSDFIGMKIQGSGAAGNTPAWSFATDPIWGSDDEAGTEKEAIVYFGNDTVVFKPVTINNEISAINNLEKVDTTISDNAVSVYQDGGAWKVKFNSNFYDKVEFKVTYQTVDGPVTEYIVVHRVGIDISTTNATAGSPNTLMHGTENGPTYTPTESSETVIYATYYYPEEEGTDQLVDMYATYTWKDGSVTREVIHNDSNLNLGRRHDQSDDLQSSDFILYKGARANAPEKIEVSAVVAGFESSDSFTGMRFGSGKGVCWNNNIGN